jgi:hypothetical protein
LKINFSFQPVDLVSGKPLKDGEKDATLASICVQALMAQTPEDANMAADEKVQAYVIASRIIKAGVVEVSVEEASLLKKRVGKLFGPMVVGQCLPALDKDATHLALVEDAVKEVANG